MPCYQCGRKSLARDDVTGRLVCGSCGAVQEFDSYESQTFNVNGPVGVRVRVGTTGSGGYLKYRDKKIYEADKLIHDVTFKLNLTGQKVTDVKSIIAKVTDGEFGTGNWFPILIGACVYVTMRSDNKSLSLAEISNVVGCDIHDLGRMVVKVVDFLEIRLPDFDIVSYFEKFVGNLSVFGGLESERVERMRAQGVFLMHCAMKWFMTTGRRPLPVVAAILVLVAELNSVEGVKIEEVAREVHATVSTCRLRYKELLEMLVKVAQALPWGKDVTMKNVVKNGAVVIRYMEMKSMAKRGGDAEGAIVGGFDLGEVVSECLRKDFVYGVEEDDVGNEDDSLYFEVGGRGGFSKRVVDDGDTLKLSHECLSMIYEEFLGNNGGIKQQIIKSGKVHKRKGKKDFDIHAIDWWNGKSELSKKLLLKQVLKKDVGLDVLPPSFIKGCAENERRRAKINAAKLRIDRIMNPSNASPGDHGDVKALEPAHCQKRKRKTMMPDIDWEDFVIETLLLHQVKEEEIETGQYNVLLDLHVFNSGVV